MMTTICNCVTSLVERVISEAVENWLNSVLEKLSTFSNTARRTSRAIPAAVRADRRPTRTEAAADNSDSASISRPVLRM